MIKILSPSPPSLPKLKKKNKKLRRLADVDSGVIPARLDKHQQENQSLLLLKSLDLIPGLPHHKYTVYFASGLMAGGRLTVLP